MIGVFDMEQLHSLPLELSMGENFDGLLWKVNESIEAKKF